MMIEIDAREFHGDRELLAKLLEEKLKVVTRVHRNSVLLGTDDPPGPHLSVDEVKGLVKRALHHMRMDEYHVVTQSGVISIRERKVREHHARRRGSVPSVKQSVPYFFPG